MTETQVRTQKKEAGKQNVAWITLQSDNGLNVLGSASVSTLLTEITALSNDQSIRALVRTGSGGKAFIGGADIREMRELDQESARTFIVLLQRCCAALHEFPVPVIARIEGLCLGAGLEIAACCDLRIATDSAQFAMPEVHVGIPSVIDAARLPLLIGSGRTRDLVMTGRWIDGTQALAWGLVERLAPQGELDGILDQWIDGILAAGPRASTIQKSLVNRWEDLNTSDAVTAGVEAFVKAYATDEPRAYMDAFFARRKKS
ncbi:MAG: enoyl-CoA hydratase [Pseudomonadota bacterium]|nr:enoyl-CoA hydratase [Pseudomonadota bacterium]